jgi:hypothetical protein
MMKEEPVLLAGHLTEAALLTVVVTDDPRSGQPGQRDGRRHLMTTFGILGSACAGIGGAVLTARGSHPGSLPYAELALAFIGVLLIAALGFACARRGPFVPAAHLGPPGALAPDDQPEPGPD